MSPRRARRSAPAICCGGRVACCRAVARSRPCAKQCAGRSGCRTAFHVSTGRAGAHVLLQALSRLSPRIAARSSFRPTRASRCRRRSSRPGCTPRIVDVRSGHARLRSADALTAAGQGARPRHRRHQPVRDAERSAARCRRRHGACGAFLIDDAAQAMGATVGGRASGTWGDAGLYSLDKGKNVSAIDGGLLVTRSEDVAARGRTRLGATWPPRRAVTVAKDAAKVVAYAAMLPPSLYWIPTIHPAARARPHRVHDRVPAGGHAVDARVAGADHAATARRPSPRSASRMRDRLIDGLAGVAGLQRAGADARR